MAVGGEDLGRAVLELVTDPTKLRAGMAAARDETTKTLASANASLRNIGMKMTATGGQMTRGVTLPVLAAGAAIVSVGTDFDHTLSKIVGLVGVSREQVNAWKPEIEALAEATGIGPVALAKGLYFVASSGIAASKAMGVLTIAARASEAGMGDVEMLADVLTGAMNAYAHSNLTAAHAMDVLVRGIQVGKAEPADFAASLGTVAPVAAQLGVTIEDLVGTMAVLSRVNSNVAENATSLGQILNTLLKPTRQTDAALAKMGLTGEGLRKELSEQGLLAVLKTLGEHIGDDDEAIGHIFPNIRALRGVLNLTGQDATSVAEAMAKVADSSGALDAAVTAVSDDASVKLNKALARLQVELIVLGADVIPVVVSALGGIVSGVHDAVTWFSALPGPVKATVVQGLTLLAVLGPILVVLGSIVTAGSAVLGAFGTLATFIGTTLIPRFLALVELLAAQAIETFASAIFATGIPALERLAIAMTGVEVAGGPLVLIAGAIIAIGLAASGATPSIADLKKSIADLESEGGLVGFFDFGRQGKIDALKRALADAEAALAAAAAKEKADLADRQKVWDEWSTGVRTTLGDLANDIGAAPVAGAVGGMIDDIDAGLKSGKYKIKNGALVMASGIPDATKTKGAEAVRAVVTSIGDMARAIRDGRREIVDAMNQVVSDAYDPLILAADISATNVELAEQRKIAASKGYSQAQVDAAHKAAKTDKEREAADRMHTVAEVNEARRRVLELSKQLATQLNDQTQYGTDAEILARLIGRATSKELVAGLKSGDKARQAASKAAAKDIASGIVALENQAGIYGVRTGNAYVDGLIRGIEGMMPGYRRVISRIGHVIVADSPPGPESPLHLIDKWGYRTGEAYMSPLIAALASGRNAVRRVLGDLRGDLDGGPPATGPSAASPGGRLAALSRGGVGDASSHVAVSIGDVHLHGIGSDVSPTAAKRFGQAVLDTIAQGFREQGARRGIHPAVVP